MIKWTKTLPNCQVPNVFFGITVNFIPQKLKSKHLLSLSQFSLVTDFLMEREKTFYTYSGPKPTGIKNITSALMFNLMFL